METSLQLNLGFDAAHRNQYLFSDHYLDRLLPDDPRWAEALPQAESFAAWMRALYTRERDHLPHYTESQLEDHWFRPILDRLGHVYEGQAGVPGLNAGVKRPDYVFFPDEAARQAAVSAQNTAEYAAQALAVGEVKRWDAPLGKKQRGGGARFEAQNPSWQIDYYVRSTGLDWGILSNGRQWRLVHRDTSQRLSIYYEVDLVDLLRRDDAGAMRYFTFFFRQAAFRPDAGGRVFVADALAASNAYALALEEDLEQNVYQALEHLMQGFLDLPGNGLGPDDVRDVYDNSLYLLYRLLFILYAESRDLLPLERTRYREHYSLTDIKGDIVRGEMPTLPQTTVTWSRLQTLFRIINGDDPALNRELGVPRYDGGLFTPALHPFLAEKAVGDRALVAAIDLLCRRESETGGREFVDYRTLGVRHLGSIYEGLLEYQPRYATEPLVAVRDGKGERWVAEAALDGGETPRVVDRRRPGQVYLETDRGERKATGSYYTPQYIVEYIVEHTLGPLVDEAVARTQARAQAARGKAARAEAAQSLADEILDLHVLDPAMGSGHFLVEATEFLALALATDPYVEADAPAEEDLTHWRRRVVERCIYGVDKNPLAVELAKLSLWLATVAADKPLSFLDHHLKCGDSLVGADVADLGWPPPPVLDKKGRKRIEQQKAGQVNMYDYLLSQRLPTVMGRILEITGVESDSYETVQAKEAADRAVGELKAPFEAVADLWVSAYFGHTFAPADYDEALGLIGQPDKLLALEAAARARGMAAERRFFHWPLAFPEVFYDEHGQSRGAAAGFDAVVGNPPYVSHGEMRVSDPGVQRTIEKFYPDVVQGHWDLYVMFIYKSLLLTRLGGYQSFITPSSLRFEKYATAIRRFMLEQSWLSLLVDFGTHRVFDEVARQYVIYVASPGAAANLTEVYTYTGVDFDKKTALEQSEFLSFSNLSFRTDITQEDTEIKDKIEAKSIRLGTLCFATFGVHAYSRSGGKVKFTTADVIHTAPPLPGYKHYIEGEDISRYAAVWKGLYLDYESKREYFHRSKFPELFESPKIMVRRISGEDNRLLSHYDTEGYYTNDNIIHLVVWDDVIRDLQSPGEYGIDSNALEYDLAYVAAVVNSTLMTWYFASFIATGTLQGTYSGIYPEDMRRLPIRRIDFTTPAAERQALLDEALAHYRAYLAGGDDAPLAAFVAARLAAAPTLSPVEEQADVVHDLLAALAERMMAMNREKQAAVEAFWLDLEGVADPGDFDTLRHRGKWESTLWKSPACRPFVGEDSRSTRHLDESLGWSEAAFKAFVRALAGSVSNLSGLVGVYRAHAPAYRDLTARLAATDWLIDRVVYRLYGLTDDEIAIVENPHR